MNLLKMNSKERNIILKEIREKYPEGTPVVLICMNDPYTKLPSGLKGIVKSVDDAGTIHILWENGSSLGVVYGEDEVKIDFKNCPFCGSNQITTNISQIAPQIHYQVYCCKCGCGTMGHPSKVKLINIWNTRFETENK